MGNWGEETNMPKCIDRAKIIEKSIGETGIGKQKARKSLMEA